MFVLFLLVAFLVQIVDSRVSFTTSEVVDDIDLRDSNLTSFRCYAGCRVYSPTQNDNIRIEDSAGKLFHSLKNLAGLRLGDFYELPESSELYWLRNTGPAAPRFVFYAVEKGAMNYNTWVLYVNEVTINVIDSKLMGDQPRLTVMSASGAVHFSKFQGDYKDSLPTVHTTGFDSISTCRPVYKAISASSVRNTAFPVYSPIATINFKKMGPGVSVVISGEPCYVGCASAGDSLYTSLPKITGFDSAFTATNSNGLSVVLDGDYSIANEADALTITVNDDVQKLYGKNDKYSKTYDSTSVKVGVQWQKKQGSTDRFALQIDVLSKIDSNLQTTTNNLQTTTNNLKTTTKSGRSFAICKAITMILSFMLMKRP